MASSEMVSEMTKGTNTRLALIEQGQYHLSQSIDRVERKIDNIEKKVDKVESKIYANLKWFIGISVPTLISVITLGFEIYQYIRQH